MKNSKSSKETLSKILDEFLKKTINTILNTRVSKNFEKVQNVDNNVNLILIIVFLSR